MAVAADKDFRGIYRTIIDTRRKKEEKEERKRERDRQRDSCCTRGREGGIPRRTEDGGRDRRIKDREGSQFPMQRDTKDAIHSFVPSQPAAIRPSASRIHHVSCTPNSLAASSLPSVPSVPSVFPSSAIFGTTPTAAEDALDDGGLYSRRRWRDWRLAPHFAPKSRVDDDGEDDEHDDDDDMHAGRGLCMQMGGRARAVHGWMNEGPCKHGMGARDRIRRRRRNDAISGRRATCACCTPGPSKSRLAGLGESLSFAAVRLAQLLL